jgi:hypothetical protein
MFFNLTKLYIGSRLIGDIQRIDNDNETYTFTLWDNDETVTTDKLDALDVLMGAGDRIVIPE